MELAAGLLGPCSEPPPGRWGLGLAPVSGRTGSRGRTGWLALAGCRWRRILEFAAKWLAPCL